MKDSDFHLLTDITPDMLVHYADFFANHGTTDGSSSEEHLLAVPPSAVFNPTTSSQQINKNLRRCEDSSMDSDDMDYTSLTSVTPDEAYQSMSSELGNILLKQKDSSSLEDSSDPSPSTIVSSASSVLHSESKNTGAFNDLIKMCSPSSTPSNCSTSESNACNYLFQSKYVKATPKTESANACENEMSETLSTIGHGSGGTVTIVRSKHSGPTAQLSEPLAQLLSPITVKKSTSSPYHSKTGVAENAEKSVSTESCLENFFRNGHANDSDSYARMKKVADLSTEQSDDEDFYDYDKLL